MNDDQKNSDQSLLASSHGLRLDAPTDALEVISLGLPGCIFIVDDLSASFFELRNGLAGEVFQKFMNYGLKVAFVLEQDHGFGDRVTELAREHAAHPAIRFTTNLEEAEAWLEAALSEEPPS